MADRTAQQINDAMRVVVRARFLMNAAQAYANGDDWFKDDMTARAKGTLFAIGFHKLILDRDIESLADITGKKD